MPNSSRSIRRVVMLGVVISLMFLGFALPRPTLKAQEPARATAKKALREQIVALHVEIDLLEVEQGIDRLALSEAIKEERAILAKISTDKYMFISSEDEDFKLAEKYGSWGGEIHIDLMAVEQLDDEALRKAMSEMPQEGKDLVLKAFGKEFTEELNALTKIEKKEEFSEVRKRLADRAGEVIRKKAAESVREKTVPLKKEFTRRSAEFAGKKLDLDSLERQYREAR